MITVLTGPACFIGNKPRSSRPVPPPAIKTVPVMTANGNLKPLRAIPYRQLNREYWSQGKVLYADSLERKQAKGLDNLKDPATMSVAELVASQNDDILSESRKAFYQTGSGVISLDRKTAYSEGTVGAVLADKGQLPEDLLTETEEVPLDEYFADEASRYGSTPYATLDPITAKQIDWEQRAYYESRPIVVKRRNGKFMPNRPFPTMDKAFEVYRLAKARLLPDPGTDAPVARRFQRMDKRLALSLGRRFERFVDNEIARYYAQPLEWDTSYEFRPTAVDPWETDPDGALEDASYWSDDPIIRVHRSPRRSPNDEFWHNALDDEDDDQFITELGTDLCSDTALELMLGRDDLSDEDPYVPPRYINRWTYRLVPSLEAVLDATA